MMLRQPISLVPKSLGVLRQIQRVPQRVARRASLRNKRQIQN